MKLTLLSLLTIALLLGTAATAEAQSAYSRTTAVTAAELAELDEVLDQLEDIAGQLALRSSLNATQTEALRRDLAEAYADLESLRARLAGRPANPGGDPAEGDAADKWVRYGEASVSVSPRGAAYNGWKSDNNIRVSYGDNSTLNLSVRNGSYTAEWAIRSAYRGAVKTTVNTELDGDLRLVVDDDGAGHEFLIKDGGLGPIYTRGRTASMPSVPSGGNASRDAWYRQYRSGVSSGSLRASAGVDWLIQQTQDNAYADTRIEVLGDELNSLAGTSVRTAPLGRLLYYRDSQQRYMDIPDPRDAPAEFAYVVDRLYTLEQDDDWYEVELY